MGLQQGENCALSRREVDLVGRRIRVEGTVVRMMSDGEERKTQLALTAVTKERRRVVPISDSVLEQLKRFRVDEGSGYLLTGTEKLPDPCTLQNLFRRMQQGLGLPAYPFAALIGKLMGISEKTAAQYVLKCRNGEEE